MEDKQKSLQCCVWFPVAALLSERLKAHRLLQQYPCIPPATASSSSTSSLSSNSTSLLGGGSLSAFEAVNPSSPKVSPPLPRPPMMEKTGGNSGSPVLNHHLPLLHLPGQQHPSELKSIEKMVNGLDIKPEQVKCDSLLMDK